MKIFRIALSLFALWVVFSGPASAAGDKTLVILDCSADMKREVGSEMLIYSAKKEVVNFVDKLKAGTEVGIMVFGHTADGCEDAELIVPFGEVNTEAIQKALAPVTANGNRGLINAIVKGLKLVGQSDSSSTIYVITSGNDQCANRDYEVEDAYAESGKKCRFVMVGVDIDERDEERLTDIVSTVKGTYKSISHPSQLNSILQEIASTTEGNLVIWLNGGDPEVKSATLRIFNAENEEVTTKSIEGFYSSTLPTGSYDIEISYNGQNLWQRGVFVSDSKQQQLTFDLDQAVGQLKIAIVDNDDQPIKGNITVFDDLENIVFEGQGKSEYLVSLPPGLYSATVKAGSAEEIFDSIEVTEDVLSDFIAKLEITLASAEISVNNNDGVPVNASITVEDQNGDIISKNEYSSSYTVNLPPGEYTAVVTTSSGAQETVPFSVMEGDIITVDVQIDTPMGSVNVLLLTEMGDSVYGRIKVYDEKGKIIPHFDQESIEDSEFAFDLPVGTYRISADANGLIRTVDGVQVTEGEETEVRITFPEGS